MRLEAGIRMRSPAAFFLAAIPLLALKRITKIVLGIAALAVIAVGSTLAAAKSCCPDCPNGPCCNGSCRENAHRAH